LGHELPLELPAADAILLTDSSLQSLGGLPIYYGRDQRLKHKQKQSQEGKEGTSESISPAPAKVPPIYSTFPTVKMGQMTLYDHHANISLDGGSPGYTLNDVDSLFSGTQYVTNTQSHTNENSIPAFHTNAPHAIQTLKYAQTLILNDPVTNQPALGITPHRAGHLVGASYFVFQRLADETMVVVAPTVHHANEGHLDSSTLDKFGVAADVLITTCGGPGGFLGELYRPPPPNGTSTSTTSAVKKTNKATLESPRVKLDESKLVTTILSTLRRGGNVLLPTDASGRVLELVLLLNQHWQSQNLSRAYNLCWVGPMVHNTVEFAKSQLEWMATTLGRQFDTGRGHPYALKHVQMFGSLEEMEVELGLNVLGGDGGEAEATNPTCVLASGATLDYGPARDLFVKWSENMENAIILTDARRCTPRGSVATTRSKTKQVLDANQSLVAPAGAAAVPSPPTRSTSVSSFGTDTPRMLEEEEATTPVAISGAPGAASSTLSTTTERVTNQWSTAAQLLQKWCEAKKVHEEMEDVIDVQLLVPHRAPLAGVELTKFQEAEEAQRLKRKKEEERRAMLREVEFAKASLHLGTEEGAAGSGATTSNITIKGRKEEDGGGGVEKDSSTTRPKKKSRFDASLFLKYSKPCHSK
jgi:cleavage and polyadenylation specificity factor subunit 2